MTKINDYEVYFNELGITSKEERDTILGFIRELFAIAIQHFNNERETVEDCL
jgi:regulator of replication initiation timing